jgi:Mycobacterium membrane protein
LPAVFFSGRDGVKSRYHRLTIFGVSKGQRVSRISIGRGIFGSHNTTSASINYLDIDAQAQRVDDTALPSSYDVTTTEPAAFANIVAQGDSDSIGRRIIIDGAVKDERSVNTVNAYTFCLDKSG